MRYELLIDLEEGINATVFSMKTTRIEEK